MKKGATSVQDSSDEDQESSSDIANRYRGYGNGTEPDRNLGIIMEEDKFDTAS